MFKELGKIKIKKIAYINKNIFLKNILWAIKINSNINKFLIYKKVNINLIYF